MPDEHHGQLQRLPHKGHHNLKGSWNVPTCFGSFSGGGLCLHDGSNFASTTRRRLQDAAYANGVIWDARKKFVIFDPEVLHATQQRRGFRIAVTAYSSRMVTRLDNDCKHLVSHYQPWTHLLRFWQQNQRHLLPRSSSIWVALSSLNPSSTILAAEQTSSATTGPLQDVRLLDSKQTHTHTSRRALQSPSMTSGWLKWRSFTRRQVTHPKDAGHPSWKVEAALNYSCPTFLSLKPGGASSEVYLRQTLTRSIVHGRQWRSMQLNGSHQGVRSR